MKEKKTVPEKPGLLIVEDDETIRTQMKWALTGDYKVFLAADGQEGLEVFRRERPLVVTLDLGLPPYPTEVTEGMALLGEILNEDPLTKVIVITGQGEKEHALKAVAEGAYDFFIKPIDIEELKVVAKRAFYVSELERENLRLQEEVSIQPLGEILGNSPQMEEVFAFIRKVAATEAPVLIYGESGTGKELVARAIHRHSPRKDGPFVVINCGAIPENLLESELFGHEKGAFTGAHIQRKGLIETAEGGSLFLDEIGELPLALQVKLLRFLQEQTIDRIGGRSPILVNTRILAATNQNLKKAVAEGRFREDLFFRLGVVTLTLPPLRNRQGDVILLAQAFLQRFARENHKKVSGFTQGAIRAMNQYSWPGNVRELENRIRRAVVMTEGYRLTAKDLELERAKDPYAGMTLKEAREALEKEVVVKALDRNNWKISQTAEELGVSRPTLYELMEKLHISK